MIQIDCTVYEKYDLLTYLNYSERKLKEDCKKKKITDKLLKMELDKIKVLKNRVLGNSPNDYFDRTSSKCKDNYFMSNDCLETMFKQ